MSTRSLAQETDPSQLRLRQWSVRMEYIISTKYFLSVIYGLLNILLHIVLNPTTVGPCQRVGAMIHRFCWLVEEMKTALQ
jgi:hypothetical protein